MKTEELLARLPGIEEGAEQPWLWPYNEDVLALCAAVRELAAENEKTDHEKFIGFINRINRFHEEIAELAEENERLKRLLSEEIAPRYAELYEAAELGDPDESVVFGLIKEAI